MRSKSGAAPPHSTTWPSLPSTSFAPFLECGSALPLSAVNAVPADNRIECVLPAAFEKQPIEQQQDHGADDRHDPARDVIFARKDATNPRAYECAGDAEQNRDDATTGIFPRHQQLCDRTDDQSDD